MPALILAVVTFHSIGLTWDPGGGSTSNTCEVQFRAAGETAWRDAEPLWFDPRSGGEYRGSLVQLRPGTRYEIRLTLADGTTQTTTATTWSETFPITRTIPVGARTEPLVVEESGTADGYVLYEGGSVDLSGDHGRDAITVRGSYVIFRGITVTGGRNGFVLDGAHDVVIEENDVSGWGAIDADGWGVINHAAVSCDHDMSVERIIVQRNRLHHPHSDANSWGEYRDRYGTAHPRGPQGLSWEVCGGHLVIRYNEITSDDDHRWNDAIGGAENFSDVGFPYRDSDIYGNLITHAWDDAIEVEGANENVRVWGNFTDRNYVQIAAATTSVGPLYVFRNIAGETQRDETTPRDESDHGPFMKLGGHDLELAAGRIYVFHNTTTQPMDPTGVAMRGLGVGSGLADSGADILENVVSRNNVFFIHKDWWSSISDDRASPSNDFDYDLYNGEINAYSGAEPNGWHAEPIFAADGITLDASSPGFDEGVRLLGFNDAFMGSAPDVGARESGAPPPEYGVDAYRDGEPGPGPGPGPGEDGGPGGGADAGPPAPRPDGSPAEAPDSGRPGSTLRPSGMTGGCCSTTGSASSAPCALALLALTALVLGRRARR